MSGFEAQLVVCDEGSNRARLTPRVTGPESVPSTSGFTSNCFFDSSAGSRWARGRGNGDCLGDSSRTRHFR